MTTIVVSPMSFHGLDAVILRSVDGAQAIVTLHGGHVVSWKPAESSQERLYLSPDSAFSEGQAIRGGVPVAFPQFANRGPLVNHGFARNAMWQLQHGGRGPRGEAQAVLRLRSNGHSRGLWPHEFVLDLAVTVFGDSLSLALTCTNAGLPPMSFTCALHTYLRIADVAQVALDGLGGQTYWDKTDGLNKVRDAALLVFDGEVDRVYGGVQRDLLLRKTAGATTAADLHIAQHGFTDVVIWNPGAARCAVLPDMPADGYRHMLCVEAASINFPVTLAGGQSWTGTQTLISAGRADASWLVA
jgi:glucose-6-phosphate 1-epimerase